MSGRSGLSPPLDTGPAAYGWLQLSARGTWLMRGVPVTHPRVRDYLAAHYQADARGAWFVQNGPQRAYVSLETAPLVLHLDAGGVLRAHTGAAAGSPRAAYLDDTGTLWLATPLGPGAADVQQLAAFAACLHDGAGGAATEAALEALMTGVRARTTVWLQYGGARVPLLYAARADVPARLGFVPDPAPSG